jgi:predicted nuclease of predicted toxin-antitoxin system
VELMADECVDAAVIDALRANGYAVQTVSDMALRGSDDIRLLAEATRRNLLFLTSDLDFGGYIFHQHLEAPVAGIVLYRIKSIYSEDEKAQIVVSAFRQFGASMGGHFTTIDPDGVRQRSLPS